MEILLFLLLPIAAWSGWRIGRRGAIKSLPPNFFAKTDLAIHSQPDPAIDTLVHMPEVDKDAIDTHLTLGNIFRKRGEMERAIRLHHGLLARSSIASDQKSLAQLELARDYLAAGVLDRAEALLLDLIAQRAQLAASLRHLLDLYQQGKEWLSAINIAQQLQNQTRQDLRREISHFYCELAEQALKTQHIKQAKFFVKRSLQTQRDCARALILRAHIEQLSGNYNKAIKLYKHIAWQDVDYFSLIVHDLIKCYQMANIKSKSFDFAKNYSLSTKYRCDQCGFMVSSLQWHCPSCKKWDVMKPIAVG